MAPPDPPATAPLLGWRSFGCLFMNSLLKLSKYWVHFCRQMHLQLPPYPDNWLQKNRPYNNNSILFNILFKNQVKFQRNGNLWSMRSAPPPPPPALQLASALLWMIIWNIITTANILAHMWTHFCVCKFSYKTLKKEINGLSKIRTCYSCINC